MLRDHQMTPQRLAPPLARTSAGPAGAPVLRAAPEEPGSGLNSRLGSVLDGRKRARAVNRVPRWLVDGPLPYSRAHAGALPLPPCSLRAVHGTYAGPVKRAIDIAGATIAIVLSLPVLALLLLALWFEGGSPLFTQERLGKGGHRFRMYKLRSMVPDAEARLADYLAANPAAAREWAVSQKLRNDPRITRLGWLIRKTSLDELPQLFNVLKGDMSLIGPRPMLPDQLPLYLHPSAYLSVRPGLSGLWQVTARNDESFEIRAEIDRHYVERLSPGLEARILLATARAVLRGTGR